MSTLPFPGVQKKVAFDDLDPARQAIVRERVKKVQREAQLKKEQIVQELPLIELELLRRKALKDQKAFTELFWHVVEPDQKLSWNWHLDELCRELHECEDTPDYKGAYNVPPGTMKSLLVSVMFRARLWAKNPSLRFLTGSYSAHLSIRDNIKLRTIVQSPLYQKLFPHLKLTTDGKEKLETSEGGWSYATSVGGGGTGEHPDYVIIDDPITAQQARSDADRLSAKEWIDRTLSTRGVVRDKRAVLIMQRLHEDDPTGHVLQKGWKHLYFPMRYIGTQVNSQGVVTYTPHPVDKRNAHTQQLLWPSLFTEKKVRDLEIALGPYGTAGQLQQRPAPEGGGLFQRQWFANKFVDAPPVLARRSRGWDTGATEGGGDDTVGVKIAEVNGVFYIEDVVAVQLGPAGVHALISTTAQLDGRQCMVSEEQEPGSAGKTVIQSRANSLVGYDYKGMPTTGDKVTRAMPFRAQCEAGNVFIVKAPWNEAWLNELEHFPVSPKDNRVDASSCAFNRLVIQPRKRTGATW